MRFHKLAQDWNDFEKEARANSRILIVDDEPVVGEVLTAALSDVGFECDTAGDADAGWGMLQTTKYDLAIIDKNMPGKSGLELIKQIEEGKLELATVLMTAYPSADTVNEALAAGVDDYIVKPFTHIDHVVSRLQSVVDQRLSGRLHNRVVGDLTRLLQEEKDGEDRELVAAVANRLFRFKQGLDKRPSVLLLEDNPTVAQLVTRALEEVRMTVKPVSNFESAKAWISEAECPLTALVSIDQYQDVSIVGELKGLDPFLEVVVTSGAPDLDLALEAVSQGATDFVLRHFEGMDVLRSRMQRAVSRARRRRLFLFLIGTLYRAAVEAGYEVDSLGKPKGSPQPEHDDTGGVDVPPSEIDLRDVFEGESELSVPPTPTQPTAGVEVTVSRPTEGSPQGKERRGFERFPTNFQVRFRLIDGGADFVYSQLRDISSGGMFIRMDDPPKVGTLMSVEIRFGPNVERPVEVFTEVVRSVQGADGRSGVGVVLRGGDRDILKAVVARLGKELTEGV